ncbi:MAG: hypothetical protein RIC55_36800 [Pirellulaceae bacterium]
MKRVRMAALALFVVAVIAADAQAQRFEGSGASPSASGFAGTLEAASPRENGVALTLSDGTRLVGKPDALEALEFKTSYGELKIPVEKIAGLRFSDYPYGGGEHACGVHFTNGDVLSARLQLKSIKLKTLVGEVNVECQHLRSLVMSVDDKVWVQVGESWKLVPAGSAIPFEARPGSVTHYVPVRSYGGYESPTSPYTESTPSYAAPSFAAPSYAAPSSLPPPIPAAAPARLAPAPSLVPHDPAPRSVAPPMVR